MIHLKEKKKVIPKNKQTNKKTNKQIVNKPKERTKIFRKKERKKERTIWIKRKTEKERNKKKESVNLGTKIEKIWICLTITAGGSTSKDLQTLALCGHWMPSSGPIRATDNRDGLWVGEREREREREVANFVQSVQLDDDEWIDI